jgi:ectoine hydroxylase-related dioxygenase (phytanoyl-CoA dioxygenase family)
MRFLPGAHRQGQLPHHDDKREGELLSRGETVALAIDEAATVPVLIDAGEVSFHHLHLPHGSGPNRSAEPRVNYVITFIDPAVRPLRGPDSALLVRGRDAYGHFEPERRPAADLDAAACATHERAMALRNAILYRATTPPPPPNHAARRG